MINVFLTAISPRAHYNLTTKYLISFIKQPSVSQTIRKNLKRWMTSAILQSKYHFEHHLQIRKPLVYFQIYITVTLKFQCI